MALRGVQKGEMGVEELERKPDTLSRDEAISRKVSARATQDT